MIYLGGTIWSIHPMAVATAREAVTTQRLGEHLQKPKPLESVLRCLPAENLPMELKDGVAIVPVSGIIVDWVTYYYASHAVLQQTFRHLKEQQPANGVILLIDSPGGMSKGSAETIDALNELQDAGVKVTAQVRGGCFSAAYKIASQCRGGIYVHRMDETGSIGTKLIMDDYSRRFKELGIEVVPITNAGADFKTIGEFGLPITEQQKTFMREHVEEVFQEFRRCVVDGRKLSDEQFAAVSDGRWWLPAEAEQLGLIDGVRTFEETLETLQTQTNLLSKREESAMAENATTEAGNNAAETEQTPENNTTETRSTETPKTEVKVETKTEPTTEQKTADVAELQKWITTFGAENGAKWFVESECSYTTALERHAVLMTEQRDKAREEQKTTSELLTQVSEKLGELDPLGLESKESREEEQAGSKESGKGSTIQEILTARNKS